MTDQTTRRKNEALSDFRLALSRLEEAVSLPIQNNRDVAGIIQSFEFTYELAWRALQKRLAVEGKQVQSPKAAFRGAYEMGWIEDEAPWVQVIADRNLTVHTYDSKLANRMVTQIKDVYLAAFQALSRKIP